MPFPYCPIFYEALGAGAFSTVTFSGIKSESTVLQVSIAAVSQE